jgi:hypothetical protein
MRSSACTGRGEGAYIDKAIQQFLHTEIVERGNQKIPELNARCQIRFTIENGLNLRVMSLLRLASFFEEAVANMFFEFRRLQFQHGTDSVTTCLARLYKSRLLRYILYTPRKRSPHVNRPTQRVATR